MCHGLVMAWETFTAEQVNPQTEVYLHSPGSLPQALQPKLGSFRDDVYDAFLASPHAPSQPLKSAQKWVEECKERKVFYGVRHGPGSTFVREQMVFGGSSQG